MHYANRSPKPPSKAILSRGLEPGRLAKQIVQTADRHHSRTTVEKSSYHHLSQNATLRSDQNHSFAAHAELSKSWRAGRGQLRSAQASFTSTRSPFRRIS